MEKDHRTEETTVAHSPHRSVPKVQPLHQDSAKHFGKKLGLRFLNTCSMNCYNIKTMNIRTWTNGSFPVHMLISCLNNLSSYGNSAEWIIGNVVTRVLSQTLKLQYCRHRPNIDYLSSQFDMFLPSVTRMK